MVIAREAELEPDIPGPLALLTATMPEMARGVRTLKEMGRRQAGASRQLSESLRSRPNPQAHKVEGAEGGGDQAVLVLVIMLDVAGVVVLAFRQAQGPVQVAVGAHHQGLEKGSAAIAGGGVQGKHRPAVAKTAGKIIPDAPLQMHRSPHRRPAKGATRWPALVAK